MVEADTLEVDTAPRAMVELAACLVIRAPVLVIRTRATVVAAVRGQVPVTGEVAMRPAAEVAVDTRAAVEVTPAVEAEVIREVADIADTTRLSLAS